MTEFHVKSYPATVKRKVYNGVTVWLQSFTKDKSRMVQEQFSIECRKKFGLNCFFFSLRSVIGLKISRPILDQSDAKP